MSRKSLTFTVWGCFVDFFLPRSCLWKGNDASDRSRLASRLMQAVHGGALKGLMNVAVAIVGLSDGCVQGSRTARQAREMSEWGV